MTSPNHELFVKVLAQIERHPETWDQTVFTPDNSDCGTACCMAGWACALSGVRLGVDSTTADGRFVPEAAASLLGFDRFAAGRPYLFSGDNTLDDLYRLSADILGIDETVLRDKVAAEVSA